MNGIRWVRVATAGRRFRTYVGRLPGGRKLPGGARPIEQIVGFTVVLIATIFATRLLPFNAIAIFGTGVLLAFAVAASSVRFSAMIPPNADTVSQANAAS